MWVEFYKIYEGKRRHIGKAEDFGEAREIINAFLDAHNYKSYYTRVMYFPPGEEVIYLDKEYKKGVAWFDVGSHSEFFYVWGVTEEDVFGDRER